MSQPVPILQVDLTPDPGLPVRILLAYAHLVGQMDTKTEDQAARRRDRLAILNRAIARLERGDKVAKGQRAARARGTVMGRPVQHAQHVATVEKLYRKKLKPDEIHRRLRGKVSLPWIYLQIRKFKK